MEPTIIDKIKEKKRTCYFISPHYDDAVLSAGALMTYLSKYTDVIVINVFTKAGEKPYTLSAKAYLEQCGYQDAQTLYANREKEDREVLGKIVKKSTDLGFVDALWRKKPHSSLLGKFLPEFDHIYPTYRFQIQKGVIAKLDKITKTKLKESLTQLVQEDKKVIFCPAGIGNHVDHVLVRTVCQSLFPNAILWSDFPYNEKDKATIDLDNKHKIIFSKFLKGKRELIEGYQTQFKAMFKKGLITKPEIFYTSLTPDQI
jgi:LmbE family N-acetylglucosaminyl deacetylase